MILCFYSLNELINFSNSIVDFFLSKYSYYVNQTIIGLHFRKKNRENRNKPGHLHSTVFHSSFHSSLAQMICVPQFRGQYSICRLFQFS